MIWIVAAFTASACVGIAMLLWGYATAPRGYQDDEGFHYGDDE